MAKKSYKVKSGDGWYRIAKNTGLDVNQLLKLNNANINTVIHPGQELTIEEEEALPKSAIETDYSLPTDAISTPFAQHYQKIIPVNNNWAEQAQAYRQANPVIIRQAPEKKESPKEKPSIATKILNTIGRGYLTNPSEQESTVEAVWGNKERPGLASDAANYVARHSLIFKPFTPAPYEGTEEDARAKGYKTYTNNGVTRHYVDYSVDDSENMTIPERAQAQLDQYGITSEQTRDKSPISTLVYEYSPGYGYNFLRMGENIIRGNKVRESGQPNTEKIQTPIADKATSRIADLSDILGFDKFASDLRESNTYPINESSRRSDLSNFYFGYPINGKSIKVSKHTQTGRGNKPDQGYFMEFANSQNIWSDPAYRKTENGGPSVQATGENMGDWSASKDSKGKKAYYDRWDINPLTHISGLERLPNMDFLGTGFELYGKQN